MLLADAAAPSSSSIADSLIKIVSLSDPLAKAPQSAFPPILLGWLLILSYFEDIVSRCKILASKSPSVDRSAIT